MTLDHVAVNIATLTPSAAAVVVFVAVVLNYKQVEQVFLNTVTRDESYTSNDFSVADVC